MGKIYKYFSHDVFNLVFERDDFCGLKFSLPKEYNDPYELLLSLDLSVPTEHLATYNDIIQELPQLPTSCFSKSPIISPMWAHYARNHSGFVLEIDTDKLSENFPEIVVRAVSYLEKASTELHSLLGKASVIGKPRYAVWLSDAVISTAYFSKYADWAYEKEVRVVASVDDVEDVGGNAIVFLPIECVTAIIFGSKFPESKTESAREISDRYALKSYYLKIGRSFPVPYFFSDSDRVHIFSAEQITEADFTCDSCSEPLISEGEQCPWCRITDSHRHHAAITNPFRVLDKYGQLDSYLEAVKKIERNQR